MTSPSMDPAAIPMDLSQVPAFPPPLGMTFDPHSPDNWIQEGYVLHGIVLAFTTIAVIIRLYTRCCVKQRMGVDDYLLLAAYLLSITFSIFLIQANKHGYGHHIWNIPASKMYMVGKLQFVGQMVYTVLLITLKDSLLLSYDRIFGKTRRIGRFLIWIGIAIVTIFYLISLTLSLSWCRPMSKVWNSMEKGECHDYDVHLVLGLASGIINMLTDFYILILPMPFVWNLNMSRRRKTKVISIFGLGFLTCITSVLRLWATVKWITDPDSGYYFTKFVSFVVLEINVGLICASALVFPAFYDRLHEGSIGSFVSRLHIAMTSNSSTLESESGTELHVKVAKSVSVRSDKEV